VVLTKQNEVKEINEVKEVKENPSQ